MSTDNSLSARARAVAIAGTAGLSMGMNLTRLKSMPGHFIRRANQISGALFAEELAGADLTSVQLIALAAIADSPELDATRVAEMIDFDKATIGGVMERLERKGLIERAVSKSDRRVKTLVVTAAGRKLLTASMRRVERVQKQLLAPLDDAEREVFMGLLRRIVSEAPR
jgi:DNA-binding MarR family transcriptional regulator